MVWIVKPSGCHCTDAFGGNKYRRVLTLLRSTSPFSDPGRSNGARGGTSSGVVSQGCADLLGAHADEPLTDALLSRDPGRMVRRPRPKITSSMAEHLLLINKRKHVRTTSSDFTINNSSRSRLDLCMNKWLAIGCRSRGPLRPWPPGRAGPRPYEPGFLPACPFILSLSRPPKAGTYWARTVGGDVARVSPSSATLDRTHTTPCAQTLLFF